MNAEITNAYEWEFHEELDVADMELNEGVSLMKFILYIFMIVHF